MIESVAQSGAANSVESEQAADAQPERPGEMRGHCEYSFGGKEPDACASKCDSSNG